jgi:hypothetical protein
MELLRLSPYTSVGFTYTIPATYTSNEVFTATITDLADNSTTTQTVTDNADYVWTITLPATYDNDYNVVIKDASGDVIHNDSYQVRRPYVDPNTLADTATDIATKTQHEELARAVIDAVITQGFYYKKKTLETVGLGADYIPVWDDVKKVLKVYENNVLIYDAANPASYTRAFEMTSDGSAITQTYTGTLNRSEGADLILPAGSTDYIDTDFAFFGAFPKTFDYKFDVEFGHKFVPSDISRATQLLITDIECGQLDYYKRYVTAYNTDQFKLQFDKQSFEGTGNILVDKILSKYIKSITRLGVL